MGDNNQKIDDIARAIVKQLEDLTFEEAECVLGAANTYLGFIKRDNIVKVDLSQY